MRTEMMRGCILSTLAAAIVLSAVLVGAGRGEAQTAIDPADFSSTITNRYFPLSELGPKVFEGTDTDPDTGEVVDTRLESRVLPETKVVAGVTVTVLEEKAYDGGELVEVALDYFAQHTNGDLYYFGEAVDNFENGQFKDHHGQWLAGEDGALPGVYVGASPSVGTTYEQELAPGIAEDKSEVLAIGETVVSPAGTYMDCVKTRDYTPLEPGIEETKWHCAGVGLVREEGASSVSELASVGAGPSGEGSPAAGAAATATTDPTPAAVPSAGTGSDGGSMLLVWVLVAGGLVIAAVGALVGGRRMLRR